MLKKSFRKALVSTSLAAACCGLAPQLALAQSDDDSPEITIETVVDIAEQEESESTHAVRPKRWLGVQLKSVQGDLARHLGNEDGIFIADVFADSPAKEAGLVIGDIIIRASDVKLTDAGQLLTVLAKTEEGSPIELIVLHKGKKNKISLTPAERPATEQIVEGNNFVFRFNTDNDGENEFKYHIHGIDEAQIQNILKNSGGKAFNMLRLRQPAALHNNHSSSNINVIIQNTDDGESMTVTVAKENDQPAKITVTEGEDVKVYSEDDLSDLPENIRVIIKPHLEHKNVIQAHLGQPQGKLVVDNIMAFVDHENIAEVLGNAKASADIQALVQRVTKESRERARKSAGEVRIYAQKLHLDHKQQVKKAQKQIQQAKEHANIAIKKFHVRSAKEESSEIQELRTQLEQLQSELAKLRKELKDK